MAADRHRSAEKDPTAALSRLLQGTVLPDLAEQARAPAMAIALSREHARERAASRTAESLADWKRRWLEQVGVAWILSCVFLRTLADRGLVGRAYLTADADGDLLRSSSAKGKGARDRLLAAFDEIGRFPCTAELLGPERNPAFRLPLSNQAAQALAEFFEQRIEGVPRFQFGEGDARLLQDLYQGISPSATDRYGLVPTPAFVAELVLDQTLEPAIRALGLEETHVIDPACGSGNFLIGAFHRLYTHRLLSMPQVEPRQHAGAALRQVHGVDVNPYAAAITRFRLMLAYMETAGVRSLAEVPASVTVDVVVADSLLVGGQRGAPLVSDPGVGRLDLEDFEAATRVLSRSYQAVVGSPPFLTCKDATLREAYRERYRSASMVYSLSAPFTERLFQLAAEGGYVGIVNSNSFMKREFGRRLVEEVLPSVELTRVIDTSGAYIPGHGTPTVLLFGRHRQPRSDRVKVVGNRRGEPILPSDPAKGRVWGSIAAHFDEVGYTDDYISVFEVDRAALSRHPWSLGTSEWTEILSLLQRTSTKTLEDVLERIGPAPRSGFDEVFLQPTDFALRLGLNEDVTRRAAPGDAIRSFGVDVRATAILPELSHPHGHARLDSDDAWTRFFWRYRTLLSHRASAGFRSGAPGDFWAWHDSPLPLPEGAIACPRIATHNHFALVPEGVLVTGDALLLRASSALSEEQRFALLGYLNSSTACYWMKHVLSSKVPVGAVLASVGMHPEDNLYEFSAVGLQRLPIPDFVLADCPERAELATLAKRLTRTARDARECTPARVLSRWDGRSQGALIEALAGAQQEDIKLLRDAVRDQDDLDWLVYASLGLTDVPFEPSGGTALPEHRPFAWLAEEAPATLAPELIGSWRARRRARPLAGYVEQAVFKRPFQTGRLGSAGDFGSELAKATEEWLAERMEDAWRGSPSPRILGRAELAAWMNRPDVRAVCSLGDANIETSVTRLLYQYAVPFLPALRFTSTGHEKRTKWIHTWEAQRAEDAGEASSCRADRPPQYLSSDFIDPAVFRIRGKLDVPRERFILYPGPDGSKHDRFGWAGWSHRERASALFSLYGTLTAAGEPGDHLVPLLCGLMDLLPSIQEEERAVPSGPGPGAEAVRRFADAEAKRLGIPLDRIREWRPPATRPRRRAQRAYPTRASRRR